MKYWCFFENLESLFKLDGESFKSVIKAICDYSFRDIEPSDDDIQTWLTFQMYKPSIDATRERYERRMQASKKANEAKKKKYEIDTERSRTEPNGTERNRTVPNTNTNTSTNTNTNTNTNINNITFKKSNTKRELVNCIQEYTSNVELLDALDGFIALREKLKKPLTEKALQLSLKKLDGLAVDDESKIDIVNQTIEHGWLTFYALKKEQQNSKRAIDEFMEKIDGVDDLFGFNTNNSESIDADFKVK